MSLKHPSLHMFFQEADVYRLRYPQQLRYCLPVPGLIRYLHPEPWCGSLECKQSDSYH